MKTISYTITQPSYLVEPLDCHPLSSILFRSDLCYKCDGIGIVTVITLDDTNPRLAAHSRRANSCKEKSLFSWLHESS